MPLRLRHIQRHAAPVAWLLLALLVLAPATPHLVEGAALLCIGADGHVEVEQGERGICADSTAADAPLALQCADHDHAVDHCGDCVDVPLLVPDTDGCLSAAPASKLDVDGAFAPLADVLVADAAPLTPLLSPTQDTPLHPSVLPAHATVVLLI